MTTPLNRKDFSSPLDININKAENLVDPQCNQPKPPVLS